MSENFRISPEDDLLTPPQIAKLWGCSPETVREIIESGELPFVNFSKGSKHPRYKCKRKWVDQYLERKAGISSSRLPTRRKKHSVRKDFLSPGTSKPTINGHFKTDQANGWLAPFYWRLLFGLGLRPYHRNECFLVQELSSLFSFLRSLFSSFPCGVLSSSTRWALWSVLRFSSGCAFDASLSRLSRLRNR